MNFVSIAFFIFLTITFIIYWQLPGRLKKLFIIISSCIFYAYWDYKYISLIVISILVSYYFGNRIFNENKEKRKKTWLVICVSINIGLLAFFKYANFIIDNFEALLSLIGYKVSIASIQITLPLGISFFIFQSLTYPLDIYNKRMSASQSIKDFATYIAFFPKLIAGPIVRAKDFLNQLGESKRFSAEDFQAGCIRILTGFIKKAAIADTLANELVNPVFASPGSYSSSILWVAMIGYAIQIYADFSGYSSMAIGIARIFGFKIAENFNFPYLATNFSDFWKRWHITMSEFFRDYIYIPLGGNRCSKYRVLINLVITMFLCGLWHGAAWTFVFWGIIHALFLSINQMIRRMKNYSNVDMSLVRIGVSWIITQLLVFIAWIFFRSESFSIAWDFLGALFVSSGSKQILLTWRVWICILYFGGDHIYGWLLEHKKIALEKVSTTYYALAYTIMIIFAYYVIPEQKSSFIYFKF